MTDYDIDKVSPRPWRIEYEFSENPIIHSADKSHRVYAGSNDDWFEDRGIPLKELVNLLHVVHCVNAHDRLVARIDSLLHEHSVVEHQLEDAAQSMWIIADQLNYFLKEIFENVPEVKKGYAFNHEGDRKKIDAVEKLLGGTWSHESSADRVADLEAMVGELYGALRESATLINESMETGKPVMDIHPDPAVIYDRNNIALTKARALVPEVTE